MENCSRKWIRFLCVMRRNDIAAPRKCFPHCFKRNKRKEKRRKKTNGNRRETEAACSDNSDIIIFACIVAMVNDNDNRQSRSSYVVSNRCQFADIQMVFFFIFFSIFDSAKLSVFFCSRCASVATVFNASDFVRTIPVWLEKKTVVTLVEHFDKRRKRQTEQTCERFFLLLFLVFARFESKIFDFYVRRFQLFFK